MKKKSIVEAVQNEIERQPEGQLSMEHLAQLQLLAERVKSAKLQLQIAEAAWEKGLTSCADSYGFTGGKLDLETGKYECVKKKKKPPEEAPPAE